MQRVSDPDQWVKDIHALHAHLMISVWGKFTTGTDNFKAMEAKGHLYPVDPKIKDWVGPGYRYTFYDAFNPDAAEDVLGVGARSAVCEGDGCVVDGCDGAGSVAPSPPTLGRELSHMSKTAAGTGASVLNAYPLENSRGVYEGEAGGARWISGCLF